MNIYLLSISNEEMVLKDIDKMEEWSVHIVEDCFKRGLLQDQAGFSYSLRKILKFIEKPARLCIRYSSKGNLFRTHRISGLDLDEVESYFAYNKEEIIPSDIDLYSYEISYINDVIYIFAIESKVVDLVDNILNEEKLKKSYLTSLSSELISYFNNQGHEDCIYYNIMSASVEYLGFIDGQVVSYDYLTLDNPIDPLGFDLSNEDEINIMRKFDRLINNIRKQYEAQKDGPYKEYALGNEKILAIYKLYSENNIQYRDVFGKEYFQ